MSVALERMLALVAGHRQARCEEILAQAQVAARRLAAEAHRGARRRMHGNVTEIRTLLRQRVAQAEAALETARRQHRQRRDFALLETAWPVLAEALRRRWHDTAARGDWVQRLARQALATLPPTGWEIVHPVDWPAVEREALAAWLARELSAAPRLRAAADVTAGLRICARGACLDGTVEGLLADRPAIEAMLLAEINRQD